MTDLQHLLKAFECGVDYGLLLAEQERDSEDLFDAAACAIMSRRTCLPTSPAPRRMPRSDAWRASKKESLLQFIELCKGSTDEHGDA
ncbi:MAG: hypothetical protein FWF60_03775 [Oscillospiraceae bacterium]|nr:hypothetical protein [Oscillospiraceae bacterium]